MNLCFGLISLAIKSLVKTPEPLLIVYCDSKNIHYFARSSSFYRILAKNPLNYLAFIIFPSAS